MCTQVQQQQPGLVPRTPGPASILSPTPQTNASASVFMFAPASSSASSSSTSLPQFEMAADLQTQSHRARHSEHTSLTTAGDGVSYSDTGLPVSSNPLDSSVITSLQPVQATVTPMAEPMANYEGPMTTIEQIPNRNILLNHSPSPCSPPHYRSALMDQTSCKTLTLPSIPLPPSSPASNTSSLASIPLHTQPISPSSPPQHDHAHSLQNTSGFSWPYQQPMATIPDFPQTLPYLPQVPAATPTSQHNSFFRVF